MNESTPEVVRIGVSGARVMRVTQQRVEYIDMAGQEQFVELEECARNWVGWHDAHRQEFLPLPGATKRGITAWIARCVGWRGALDGVPWVQFMNERRTRFKFGNREALYAEVLTPLAGAGWHTFDTI